MGGKSSKRGRKSRVAPKTKVVNKKKAKAKSWGDEFDFGGLPEGES
jgi:hypothetical protein